MSNTDVRELFRLLQDVCKFSAIIEDASKSVEPIDRVLSSKLLSLNLDIRELDEYLRHRLEIVVNETPL